jgi:hypothetical protein
MLYIDSMYTIINFYTFEELNPHACGFNASKCYPFIDFKTVQSTVSNLQWCKPMNISIGTLATLSHMNAKRSSRRPIEDLSVSTVKD